MTISGPINVHVDFHPDGSIEQTIRNTRGAILWTQRTPPLPVDGTVTWQQVGLDIKPPEPEYVLDGPKTAAAFALLLSAAALVLAILAATR